MTLDSFLQNFASTLPQGSLWSLGVAFVGGILASSVCPCTLPMGLGMASIVGTAHSRKSGLSIAFSFFLGIVINLVLLGLIASRIGEVLTESFGKTWTLVMAILSLAAAIAAFFGPRLKIKQLESFQRPGIVGAFAYGFIFSLGTSAAPLLLLLTIAAAQASPEYGTLLSFAFGIGRGLPFLVIGIFAGALTGFTRMQRWARAIQTVSALSLLFVSVYYLRAFIQLTAS